MIIDANAVILTLMVVTLGGYFALKVIRAFALQIARENHDTILALDQTEEQQRQKKTAAADAAEKLAFSKVQPILNISVSSGAAVNV